jgi:hypothetical protein
MPKLPSVIDELASALNGLLQQSAVIGADAEEIDPAAVQAAVDALARYDLARDRVDLDAVTLPVRTVITLQDGAITGVMTDSPHPCEVAVIDYDVDNDWEGADMAAIPQEGSKETMMAQAFKLIPAHNPPRVAVMFNAVVTHDCPTPSKH